MSALEWVTHGVLPTAAALLGAYLRGSKWDMRLRARLRWLTLGLKGVAAHVKHELPSDALLDKLEEASETGEGRQ